MTRSSYVYALRKIEPGYPLVKYPNLSPPCPFLSVTSLILDLTFSLFKIRASLIATARISGSPSSSFPTRALALWNLSKFEDDCPADEQYLVSFTTNAIKDSRTLSKVV